MRLYTFYDPLVLSNEPSCEAGSFSCHHNSHRFLQSEILRLYFPMLEPWVMQPVLFPSCSSQFICRQMWDHSVCQPPSCLSQSSSHCLAMLESSLPWLPISTPSTHLDECFFFNSSVARLPYSSIFWQFSLVLFLNS